MILYLISGFKTIQSRLFLSVIHVQRLARNFKEPHFLSREKKAYDPSYSLTHVKVISNKSKLLFLRKKKSRTMKHLVRWYIVAIYKQA